MASRNLRPENWTQSPQTRIQTRRVKEPRDEQLRFPQTTQRVRPIPINITRAEPSTSSRSPPMSPTARNPLLESALEPEIVDLAAPNTWPRRLNSQRQAFPKQLPSPSIASTRSARQSEISRFLDYYYIRGPSLDLPPPTPRLDTPIIDPGLEKFDFGLPLKTPSPRLPNRQAFQPVELDTTSGAEAKESNDSNIVTTPPSLPRSHPASKTSYRLFPIVKDTSPPSDPTVATESPYPRFCTPTSKATFVPSSHNHPDPSYRPRRESISSSIRSRKDSFTSFSGTKRIPMRVLSEGAAAKSKRSSPKSSSTGSPPERSRWSDDTVTSPLVATTLGPRTSFSSLLGGRDSAQYPACFFEDDDEAAPLRRKFPWKRSGSLTQEQRQRRRALTGERRSLRSRVRSVVLCAGCCGGDG